MKATKAKKKRSKIQLEPYQVVLRPLVTEKGTKLASDPQTRAYTFVVNPLANKTEIRAAVEELFDVKVEKVRTQTRIGKPRRYRFRYGRTKSWKKAVVKLDEDSRIDFF
ncbi:MAG: 50S ribosomal protein L23 [Planctomycetaceae bacterium]|nr:50S ribosomal protein L23 [Planctomycetaceae bacterium]